MTVRRAWPKRAIVLAAGLGTRMRPLTGAIPKPLLPLWGRPLLAHVLDALQSWGVDEALINLHHAPGPILRFAAARRDGPRICLSYEPDILGTGGALRRAAWFIGDSPFWLVNADIAIDLDPAGLVAEHRRRRSLATAWLHAERGPRTVETIDGDIVDFRSRRPASPGTATMCGLHLLQPEILDVVPARPFSTLVDAYERALAAGVRVSSWLDPGSYWEDLGTPAAYLAAHRDIYRRFRGGLRGARLFDPAAEARMQALRRAGVVIDGFAAVDATARVAPGARLRDVVLWPGARVERDGQASDAIVAGGAPVAGRVHHIVVPATAEQDPGVNAVLAALGWPAAEVVATVYPARGSDRSFTRLRWRRQSVIAVNYGDERPENRLYARHARYLRSLGVNVPAVRIDRPAQGLLALEDLGDRSLEETVRDKSEATIRRWYRGALAQALRLHRVDAARARRRRLRLAPAFTPTLYRWERNYFSEHFLHGHVGVGAADRAAIDRELQRASRRLLREPLCLVHRDLQASNVLVHRHSPYLIDFQGMRLGVAAYDVASLLCDPYVMLTTGLQRRLLRDYAAAAGEGMAVGEELFWLAAIQRLAQAIGAYARLGALPATASFQRHLGPGVEMMRRAIDRTAGLPVLRAILRDFAAGSGPAPAPH